jgi:hypothetical protein
MILAYNERKTALLEHKPEWQLSRQSKQSRLSINDLTVKLPPLVGHGYALVDPHQDVGKPPTFTKAIGAGIPTPHQTSG